MSKPKTRSAEQTFWKDEYCALAKHAHLLKVEHEGLVAQVKALTAENADLRRLVDLQQRRIDGLEAEGQ